jgi:DNA-directed RNA polymerase alpha subunit
MQTKDNLEALLALLLTGVEGSDRSIQILKKRMLNYHSDTYDILGNEYGVTIERIRQIELKMFRRLYHRTSKVMIDYSELERTRKKLIEMESDINDFCAKIKNTVKDDNIGRIKVSKCEFTVRTINCLENEGIEYLDQLQDLSEGDMLRTPNFGRKSLNELKEEMAKYSMYLGYLKYK